MAEPEMLWVTAPDSARAPKHKKHKKKRGKKRKALHTQQTREQAASSSEPQRQSGQLGPLGLGVLEHVARARAAEDWVPRASPLDEATSESSSGMDRRLKLQKRRERFAAPKRALPQVLSAPQAVLTPAPGTELPDARVLTFDDMISAFPHMQHSLGSSSAAPGDESVLEEPLKPPPVSDILRKHIEKLPRPEYIGFMQRGMGQEELFSQLERRVVSLPLQSARLESQLLGEAGLQTLRMPDGSERHLAFPFCVRGAQCVGMTARIEGFTEEKPGAVLTSIMFEQEYEDFVRTGIAPIEQRCCVLCARVHFSNYIFCLRANDTQLRPSDESFAFQMYRNLKDEEGGYYGIYINQPSSNRTRERGFFDCIAVFSRSELRAYRDPRQGGRWMVDQSAMVWEPEPPVVPRIGEALSDFVSRVRKSQDALSSCSLSLQLKLESWHDSVAFLTRLMDQSWGTADACWAALRVEADWRTPCFLRSAEQALSAEAQLSRALRLLREQPLDQRVLAAQHHVELLRDQNAGWLLTAFPYDLQLMAHLQGRLYTPSSAPQGIRRHVREVCFWSQQRSSHMSDLVHLLNKTVNQPCQTRKFSSMVRRFIRNNQARRNLLLNLLLGALLGQYPDVPSVDRLSLQWRTELRRLALQQPAQLERLLTTHPNLVLFALRKCMMWWVAEEPAMHQHLVLFFKWAEFELTVANALREVRRQFSEHSPAPSGELPRELLDAVERVCLDAHREVLLCSYKRQRSSITSVLHTCKCIGNRMQMCDEDDGEAEPAVDGVSPELQALLYDWVRRYDPRYDRLEDCVFPYLHLLGLPSAALHDMNSIVEEYDLFRMGKRALRQRVIAFTKRFPYSFAVYQAVCGMWAEHSAMYTYKLPQHYRVYQLQALADKYGLDPNCVPLEKVHLLLCSVCHCVYSILRMPTGADVKHKPAAALSSDALPQTGPCLAHAGRGIPQLLSEQRHLDCAVSHVVGHPVTGVGVPQWSMQKGSQFLSHAYQFGYTDCAWDPFDMNVYCKLDRVKGHLRCSRQPLDRCTLLGTLLWNRGLIALCPQEGCGLPFMYSAAESVYTKRGFACSSCSLKIAQERWAQRVQLDGLPLDLTTGKLIGKCYCTVCGALFTARRPCFIYPRGVLLCAAHHSSRTQSALSRGALMTAEEAVEAALRAQRPMRSKHHFTAGRGAHRVRHSAERQRKFYI